MPLNSLKNKQAISEAVKTISNNRLYTEQFRIINETTDFILTLVLAEGCNESPEYTRGIPERYRRNNR